MFASELMGTSRITLLDLANGSIQQEHRMELHETAGKKRHHIRRYCNVVGLEKRGGGACGLPACVTCL